MQWLAAWRSGDANAGKQLFARHYAKISRFFFNKVSEDDAADLIQRTFLRCVERQHAKWAETSFGAFLFGIARNVLLEHYRRRYRMPAIDLQSQSLADLGPAPASVMDHRLEAQLLLQALRQLPIETQITLELYMFEGLPGKEIAAVVGVPLGTIRTWIHRGRNQLREKIEALTLDPSLRESTVTDLDEWARLIRERMSVSSR